MYAYMYGEFMGKLKFHLKNNDYNLSLLYENIIEMKY